MTIPLKRRTDGLGEFQSGDVIPIEHGGTGATNIGDVQDILGISDKLDAADYVQHFRGVFTSFSALATAIPVGNDGDYAHIDSGSGFDLMAAIWDTSDSVWIVQDTNVGANTDEVPEGSTNLYFTSARVRSTTLTGFSAVDSVISAADTVLSAIGKAQGQITGIINSLAANVRSTVLTGLSTATGGTITSSDTVLSALGKLQNQVSAASGSVTWVDITTISGTTLYTGLNLTNTKIELAKINGFLWLRGVYTSGTGGVTSSGEVFRVTSSTWFVNTSTYTFISNPVVNVMTLPVSASVNQHKLQQISFPYTGMSFFCGSAVAASTSVVIPPICVGMAV